MPGILVGNQEIVRIHPHPFEGRSTIGRHVDVVLGECQRFSQQIPNACLVVDDEHAWPSADRRDAGRGWGRRRPSGDTWPLAVEPGIDVGLAKTPLASNANRRDLAGLNQTIDSGG
jgi:hypothetical protein